MTNATETPERALREAEGWLASAKQSMAEAHEDDALYNVCCAEAIHAIIRANDVLSLKFFGNKPTRHDDAAIVFAKLIREGKIPKDAESFKSLVAKAMMDKSGADYGKKVFREGDACWYVENAEQFVAMVRGIL